MPYIGKTMTSLSDYDKVKPAFIVMYDETHGEMGADYGPPDPPPTMEYHTRATIIDLADEAELLEWLKQNQETKYGAPKKVKVFSLQPVSVQTNVSISLGK